MPAEGGGNRAKGILGLAAADAEEQSRSIDDKTRETGEEPGGAVTGVGAGAVE
jgi:hypothetical protein